MDQADKALRRERQRDRDSGQADPATGPQAPEVAAAESARPEPDIHFLSGRFPFPSDEEFQSWCEHPVTRFVATGYQQAAFAVRDSFLQMVWDNGVSPSQGETFPEAAIRLATQLEVMRSRAEAYTAFFETKRSDYAKFIRP